MQLRIVRASMYGLGLTIMIGCMSSQVLAGTPVPEIGGSSLSVGLAAVSAGFLILRSRRGSK